MPDNVYTRDVLRGFRFEVVITLGGGISPITLGFQKVSGLQADVGVYEWEEISDSVTAWKLPSTIKFADLVLERGATTDQDDLWAWYMDVVNVLARPFSSRPIRGTVDIKAIAKGNDRASSATRRWKVFSAFPKSMKFGALDATKSVVLVESLTLAHEGYKMQPATQASG